MAEAANAITDSAILGEGSVVRGLEIAPADRASRVGPRVVSADLAAGFHLARAASAVDLLLVCHAGAAWVRLGSADPGRLLVAGQALYVPRGAAVDYRGVAGERFGHIGMEWGDPATAPGLAGPRVMAADAAPLQHACEGYLLDPMRGMDLGVEALWSQLIDRLGRRILQAADEPGLLRPLLGAMQRDPGDDWSIAAMCQVVGMSERTLRRHFQRELGESPLDTLLRLRLDAAAALLATTDLTLQDIALQVGYQSAFSLSRVFSRQRGRAPSDYRRAARGG